VLNTLRDNAFKIANKMGIPYLLKKSKGQSITVLSLHRISKERDFFFDPIDPKTFEKLIQYCLKNYEIISFSDVHKKTNKPKLILSFDDGYYDFMEYSIPVLMKYNLPSNLNLVNSCLNQNTVIWTQKLNDIFNFLKCHSIIDDEIINMLGTKYDHNWNLYYISFFKSMLKLKCNERNSILENLAGKYNIQSKYRMMNWEEAKLCSEKFNVEIGCHTYNHESLFTINTLDELNLEIGKSIEEMEKYFKKKTEILALPNGLYNESILNYAKTKDLKYILLVDDNVTLQRNINSKLNLISRINLVNENIDEMIFRSEMFHSKMRKFL
jgi:peptidoglycan/xylan/chitin deacetylase (PgdA/CDA1 family)